MSWGQLGEAVHNAAPADAPALPGYPVAELATIMDQHIAWHESGHVGDPLGLPPLFSVVRLIAGHITQLPMTAGGGPLPRWLDRPRTRGSALDRQDLLQYAVTSMCLNGAAYLQVRYVAEGAWQVDVLHPSSVTVQVSPSGPLRLDFYLDGQPIRHVPYSASEWTAWGASPTTGGPVRVYPGPAFLLHIPYLVTPNHPAGCSPVTVARESLHGYGRVESQAADLLDRGTYSGGRLETEHEITRDAALRYQEAWMNNRKTGKIPVLGAGLRYQNDLLSPKDAMWLESRAFNAQQIAMMYGVPPDLLGMTMQGGGSSLAYNNAQDNNTRYLRNALMPISTQIAAALSLLLGVTDGSPDIEFDYDDFTGGADVQEAQAQ